jgi:hypothetical protein
VKELVLNNELVLEEVFDTEIVNELSKQQIERCVELEHKIQI